MKHDKNKHVFVMKYITTQNEQKNTKARFGRLLRPPPRNGTGLFWKKEISKEANEQESK